MSNYSTYRSTVSPSYEEVWLQAWCAVASMPGDLLPPEKIADTCLAAYKKRFSTEPDEFTQSINHFSNLQQDVQPDEYRTLSEYNERVMRIYEGFLENLGYEDVIQRFRLERGRVFEREKRQKEVQP